jgi:hypothetical protein
MNKIALALLGCSSFYALTMINVNPALAEKLSPMQMSNPILRQTDNQSINPPVSPVSTEDPQTPSVRAVENDTVKELAIKMFGCDCPSCQAMASNLLLQGQLPSS